MEAKNDLWLCCCTGGGSERQTTWESDVHNNSGAAESIKSDGLWEVEGAGTEQDVLAAVTDWQIVGQETEESEGHSISGFLQSSLFLPDPLSCKSAFLVIT